MFNDQIKSLRSTKKITQSELAKRLGIARTTYAGYENGSREPDHKTLQKIADYFEVTTDYLLGRSDHPQLTEVEDKERDSEVEELMKIIESLPEDERKEIEEDILNYGNYLIDKKHTNKN